MNPLDELIAQIPIRHNLVSYLVFSGVLMGFLMAGVIGIRAPRTNRALHYYAVLMGCLAIITLDTFFCYTGWMKYTLALNDSTEPLTLLLAPLLYLSIRFLILRRPLPPWVVMLHLLPALLYALSQIPFYLEPLSVKYNAYKGAYFPELNFAEVPEGTTYGYQKIKNLQRWFLLLGFLAYGTASARLWYRHRKDFGNPAGDVRISKYRFVRLVLVILFATFSILFLVYINYEDDAGDHYITLFTSGFILAGAVAFLMESRFFQSAWLSDKYETSSKSHQQITMDNLIAVLEQDAYYTSPQASLKGLAAALEVHPNTVSRLINQQTQGNFNDFLNGFRIQLAKERLRSEAYRHLTIEAVGKSVGFRSKSAFYQAFKKHVGASPSHYMKGV